MLREERLWLIAQKLMEDQKVIGRQLADAFGLNLATIRLDLEELERRGVARRVYGGAVLAASSPNGSGLTVVESPFTERLNLQRAEKEAIGCAAAELIHDGETIMMDGGSTTYQVCRNLSQFSKLTVISCAVHSLWAELLANTGLQVFLTGGFLRPESLSLVGEFSTEMLRSFRASKTIIGIDGVSMDNGFTALNFLEADIKKKMIAASEQLVIVTDHTKFGKVGPIPVASLEQATYVVTDAGVSADYVERLERAGIQVIVADASAKAVGVRESVRTDAERPLEKSF